MTPTMLILEDRQGSQGKDLKFQILFYFNSMKNSIPSTVLMIDKNNNIIDWNKKAEEILNLKPEQSKGINLLDLDLLKKERVKAGLKQFEKEKQHVKIKSISFKDNEGDVYLTNISQMPLHDNNGQFQGSIMILEDVSEKEEIQAELIKRQEELSELDSRFQQVYSKLRLVEQERFERNQHLLKVTEDKQKDIEHIGKIIDKKKNDLETINNNIISKTNELESINLKIADTKSKLMDVENELAQKKVDLEYAPKNEEELSKTFKDKLKIIDEIDKSLGIAENQSLKTKKIDAENIEE